MIAASAVSQKDKNLAYSIIPVTMYKFHHHIEVLVNILPCMYHFRQLEFCLRNEIRHSFYYWFTMSLLRADLFRMCWALMTFFPFEIYTCTSSEKSSLLIPTKSEVHGTEHGLGSLSHMGTDA